jgi:hypothetical protein
MYIDAYISMYILIGIPIYGPLLSTTDSDAVAWCLSWVTSQGDVNRGEKDEEMRERDRDRGGVISVAFYYLCSYFSLLMPYWL